MNLNTELALVNTTTNSGTIILPLIANNQGRVISFKDIQGTFGTNSLTLQCSGSDTFEDNSTTKILRESYGSIQIVGSGTKWYILNGTQVNTIQVSTLNTITISSFNICTINSQISSLTFIDSFRSTTNLYAAISSVSTQAVSTNFLYYNNFVIAGTRIGYSNLLNRNSFSIFSLAGLALWLDASDTTTVRLSGTNVVSILDKSQNGLTMTAVGTVPYVTAAQNGLNAVGNLTTSGYLATPSNNFDFNYNNYSIYATFRTPAAVGGLYPLITKNFGFGTGAPTSNNWSLFVGNQNPPFFSSGFTARSGTGTSATSPTFSTSTWILASSQIVRSITATVSLVNGTPGASFNAINAPVLPGNIPILIGASILGSSPLSLSGLVGEILVVNGSTSVFQRQQVEGYLAWKWGLQANLPATHPFRNAPPQ